MTSEPTPPVVHDLGAGAFLQPGDAQPQIVCDPRFAFGAPTVARTGTPVDAVVGMFRAGETMAVVADEYGLTLAEAEAALRYRLPSVDDFCEEDEPVEKVRAQYEAGEPFVTAGPERLHICAEITCEPTAVETLHGWTEQMMESLLDQEKRGDIADSGTAGCGATNTVHVDLDALTDDPFSAAVRGLAAVAVAAPTELCRTIVSMTISVGPDVEDDATDASPSCH